MASMKVKAGIKSDIAVAKVGELKPIPKNLSIWTLQLQDRQHEFEEKKGERKSTLFIQIKLKLRLFTI